LIGSGGGHSRTPRRRHFGKCLSSFFSRHLHRVSRDFLTKSEDKHVEGSISILIRVYASCEYTHTMFIEKMFTSVCTSPFHMCALQHRFYPYLFHPPEHMLTCACTPRLFNPNKEEAHLCNRELYMTWSFWMAHLRETQQGKKWRHIP